MDEERDERSVTVSVVCPPVGFEEEREVLLAAIREVQGRVEAMVRDDPPSAPGLGRHVQMLRAALPVPEQEAEITVRGLSAEELNAVRRTLAADIRTLAVDVASISANSSVMHDEMLASRIAYVPLRAPRDLLDRDDAVVQIVLRAHLPASEPRGRVLDVMSDALTTSDPRVQPQPGIRICRLRPGQSVDVVAMARPGTAREHSKWLAVHTSVVCPAKKGEAPGALLLRVGTNFQMSALEAAAEAVRELRVRLAIAMEDVLNPGGPRVAGADPEVDEGAADLAVVGAAYA